MKELADAWAAAADKAVPFAVAEAVLLVGYAICHCFLGERRLVGSGPYPL